MKEAQDKLFADWKKENEAIVTDGIVDENAYLSSPKKILYLLKEVYGGESWDLCGFLKEGKRWQTWNNITRWTVGIHQPNINWSEIDIITDEKRKEALKKICVVNVKKTSGEASSKNNELLDAVNRNKERLKKQLSIYNPDLIVCGGTAWLYKEIYDLADNWESTSNKIKYLRRNKTVVIAYHHPQMWATKRSLYEKLINAIKEIEKNKTA